LIAEREVLRGKLVHRHTAFAVDEMLPLAPEVSRFQQESALYLPL
jgi:hypothetical protein